MATISSSKFQAILDRMKARQQAEALSALVATNKVDEVDLTSLGLPNNEDGSHSETTDILTDIALSLSVKDKKDASATSQGTKLPSSVNSVNETTTNVDLGGGSVTNSNAANTTIGVARDIILNAKQQEFEDLILSGKSCVLIGSAGTGKTTSMRSVTSSLLKSKKLPRINAGTKWLQTGTPGAAILSFTNKAVNNIRHAVVPELKANTITAHKLLEFQPVFFEIDDPENPGRIKKTMRFEPTRHALNPLPADLVFLAWEESSMVGVPLYNLVQDAMPHAHQEVFLGDIQQLPPVFGLAVLGFKMLELPAVELTEIYRQAASSPIISLAHAILKGDPSLFSSKDRTKKLVKHPVTGREIERIVAPALDAWNISNEAGTTVLQPFQQSVEAEVALNGFANTCKHWIDTGYFDPEEDIILCPQNVGFGTIEINKKIAQYLGTKRGATVWEVIAGFHTHYLAVGDRVLYDKEDATIISISHNGNYMGKRAQIASETLDRWGHHQRKLTASEEYYAKQEAERLQEEAADFFLDGGGFGPGEEAEDRVNAASHVVTVKLRYSTVPGEEPEEFTLESAGEINNLLGGYALTVHKFQGSECANVILVLHSCHQKMASRELLYTAVTRAKKRLHIICEFNTFERGILSQRIKGDTLEEKADFFKGKRAKNESDTLSAKTGGLGFSYSDMRDKEQKKAEVENKELVSEQTAKEEVQTTPIQSALARLRALRSPN